MQFAATLGCCGFLVRGFADFNFHIPANAAWFVVCAAFATWGFCNGRFIPPFVLTRGYPAIGRGGGFIPSSGGVKPPLQACIVPDGRTTSAMSASATLISTPATRPTAARSEVGRRYAPEAVLTGVGGIVSRVLQGFAPIILARYLGPREYGVYVLVISLVGIVAGASPLGQDTALEMSLPEYSVKNPSRGGAILTNTVILFSGRWPCFVPDSSSLPNGSPRQFTTMPR
jgi:hypothetical protein